MTNLTLYIILGVFLLIILTAIGLAVWIHQSNKEKVRLIISYQDGKTKIFKVKPSTNNTVSISDRTFNINEKTYTIMKNMPTYFFNSENTEPIDVYSAKATPFSPSQYKVAIDNKIVEEIFKSSKKHNGFNKETITMVVLIGIAGVLGLAGFLLKEQIDIILQKLDIIITALKNIGLEV